MKIRQLKVKIKSLAAEQVIIKHETRKAHRHNLAQWRYENGSADYAQLWDGKHDLSHDDLRDHRIHIVRPEIRAALIAYGYFAAKHLARLKPSRNASRIVSRTGSESKRY